MTLRRLAVVNALLCAATISMAIVPSQGYATPQDKPAPGAQAPAADKPAAPATEDVIFTSDGRELHGQIISETKAQVVFEYRDAKLNIKTRLTLQADQIAHIDRKVPVSDAVKPAATAEPAKSDKAKPAEDERKDFGAVRVQSTRTDVPSLYIVPMKGQMGTDINTDVYKKVRDDIRALKPDVVVIQMFCQDTEDVLYSEKDPEKEGGLLEWDEYRDLVKMFRDELRDFRQVCWIEDSVGISSMVAMSWPEIYMKQTGRFGGLQVAHTGHFRIADLDVRGKMVAALMAWVKSFLEYGGYSLVLADAMVQPEKTLSATWQGRNVIWSLDDKGEYLVDGDDKHTVNFRAKHAEDFGISHGTADTVEDLGLLLGYREFRVLDGQAEKLCGDYVEDWRRAFAECKKLLEDYQQFMGWAGGEDEVKYLGRAMSALEKILANMKQYKAVQIRMEMEGGPSQRDLTILIEQIKERLRALKNREKAGSGSTGGGGGRMGGRGGAGSPGPPR